MSKRFQLVCIVVALASSLLAPAAFAQVIYTNGTLSTGATAENGAAAPAGTNWSEVQHDTGNTTEANTNGGYSVYGGSFRLADDFTVPAGQNWTLTGINVFGYKTGSAATPSPFVSATLEIWNGRPGDPTSTLICGDASTNVLAGSTDVSLFRIFNSAVPPPGSAPGTTRRIWRNQLTMPAACAGADFFTAGSTYWFVWDTTDSAAGTHFAPSNTIPGARSAAGDNARQFVASSASWTDVIDLGAPATAPDVPQDFPFQLLGTASVPDRIFANGFEL
jgi:hypothetical protein